MEVDPIERTLVERLRARDQSAVADLSTAYGSKIHQSALRYLKNREGAEEVAQDVLLKVHHSLSGPR